MIPYEYINRFRPRKTAEIPVSIGVSPLWFALFLCKDFHLSKQLTQRRQCDYCMCERELVWIYKSVREILRP